MTDKKQYDVSVRYVRAGVDMGDHGQDVFSVVALPGGNTAFGKVVNEILQRDPKYDFAKDTKVPNFSNYLIVQLVEPLEENEHE